MRILNGTKVIDAEPGWREALLRGGRRVVIDLGAGDGRFAYESARTHPAAGHRAAGSPAAPPPPPRRPTRAPSLHPPPPPPRLAWRALCAGEPLPVPDETYIDPTL